MNLDKQKAEAVCIDSGVVRELIHDILQKLNVPSDECSIVTEVLLEASLSGYDSHGVMRIPMYVDAIRQGAMIPGAKIKVINETSSSVHLDGGRGLGPVTATYAVQLASQKANETGVGCVGVVNSNDLARLGSYLLEPARKGLIAIMMVNDAGGGPSVAPWGGVEALLSTNPIAAGIPRRGDSPIIIDISTSVVSVGKLKMFANLGDTVPQGWIVDKNGNYNTDPKTFFADPKQSALLPLGGILAGYKGFALSLLIDILAGGLGGAGCSAGLKNENCGNGVFVLVIDPAMFNSRENFTDCVEGFVERVKNSKKAPGVEEILIPGERAFRERQIRTKEGIPIDPPTWKRITEILDEFGINDPTLTPHKQL